LRAVQISTGAQNDLEKITQMAYSTVAVYGMNAKIGLVSFPPNNNRMDKPYSDETANLIDSEARKIIQGCYETTLALLREKKAEVEALAQVRGCSLCDNVVLRRPRFCVTGTLCRLQVSSSRAGSLLLHVLLMLCQALALHVPSALCLRRAASRFALCARRSCCGRR
jgi:Peptidase family M41